MTLTIMDQLEQGSDAWHDQRRGIVTASVIGKLITPKTIKAASNDESRGLLALLASERITGWTEPTYVNFDMQRGIDDEPRARDHYIKHHAPVTEVGFMVLEQHGWKLGYSPDGLVGDDGLIEVKSRRPKTHLQTWTTNAVPIYNMAQIQTGLYVSGREWCDYVGWCNGLPMFVKRVGPDARWFDAIEHATTLAEEAIVRMVEDFEQATHGLPATERVLPEMEMSF